MERFKHGGQIYDKKVQFDFSANVNPLGLPEKVTKSLAKTLEFSCFYPDDTCATLREAIEKKEKVTKDWIICGNGASDLIFRVVHATKPKKAMVLAPTFSEYEKALESVDCEIQYHLLFEEDKFMLTERILDELHGDLDIIFLCNPNNPVGNLISNDLLEQIIVKCSQENILLILDECFLDFVDDGEKFSGKKYICERKNLFVLKAFTKIYGMAGLRLGYGLCSDEKLLESMALCGPSWNVSTPAQIAGIEALKQQEYIENTKELIKKERAYLYGQLCKLGFHVYQPKANFIFFEAEEELYEKMLAQEILIRPCDNYLGLSKCYYRIAVRSHEENVEFVKALIDCIQE